MGSLKKPLLIYDGDCGFCKRWISLWEELTGSAVDYQPSQVVGKDFPNIPMQDYDISVVLVLPSGEVFRGAGAVLRVLAQCPGNLWWARILGLDQAVPAFSALFEFCYAMVARNRVFFSKLTRLFYGERIIRSTYFLTRWIFLRGLGVVYLVVFLSLRSQIHGLVGSTGILKTAWSDLSLDFLWGFGALGSIFLILGFEPVLLLVALWASYYCLVQISGEFFWFQWDSLMLEMGLLAVFLAPFSLFPRLPRLPLKFKGQVAPPFTIIFLLRWLLFRVVFFSGWVKLASGDPTWKDLTALSYHFETQPLLTPLSPFMHQLPIEVHQVLAVCMFGCELVAPLLIFLPRKPRALSCLAIVVLQISINLTGNYGFFGWQVICLCIVLLDDSIWFSFFPKIGSGSAAGESICSVSFSKEPKLKRLLNSALATLVLLITLFQVETLRSWIAGTPLDRAFNQYGVFAVMTTQRDEIIIEGSEDGQKWLPYEFRYKPGDVKRPLSFVTFYMPRLDWQMWFAALQNYGSSPWVGEFMMRLLEGSPSVLYLMGQNPFENQPPRYVRALRYRYKLANFSEFREHGERWKREFIGPYSPILSLR